MAATRVVRLRSLQNLQCGAPPSKTTRAGLQNSDRIQKRWNTYTYSSRQKTKPTSMDDFYADLLKRPRKAIAPQTRTSPAPQPTQELSKTEEDEKIAKARVIFGSRLAGPVQRRRDLDASSTRIAGILVPPRPEEPDNCCMSGCVNCVWDRYRDELEEWAEKSAQARSALTEQRRQQAKERSGDNTRDVLGRRAKEDGKMPSHVANSMDDDGGGSETNWQEGLSLSGESGDLFAGIPVGIREFMRTEKRLQQQKKKVKQKVAAPA